MRRAPLWLKLLVVIALLAVAGVVLSFIPAKTIAIAPHKPVDLKDRVRIDGRAAEPLHGHLYLVGVTEVRVTLLQKWLLAFDDEVTLEPEITTRNRQVEHARDRDAIRRSKEVAAAAAYELLGERVVLTGAGAFVAWVDDKGPAGGLLKAGDRIVRVNGREVDTSADVTRLIGSLPPGSRVILGVRRNNLPRFVTVRTGPPLEGDDLHRSRIGVSLNTPRLRIKLPHKVAVNTDEIVGPSAALAFALAVYDSESPADLLRGRYIVATGALSLDGEVLGVGGTRQKAIATQEAGYDILIVPRSNVDDAVKAVKEFCAREKEGEEGSVDCTRVLGVGSVRQAVQLLRKPSSELEREFAN